MCSRMIAPIRCDHNVLVRLVSREDVKRDYQTAGGQPINKIMRRQASQNDGSNPRKYHGEFLFDLAVGKEPQIRDGACPNHYCK